MPKMRSNCPNPACIGGTQTSLLPEQEAVVPQAIRKRVSGLSICLRCSVVYDPGTAARPEERLGLVDDDENGWKWISRPEWEWKVR
jgi:hypothetical protein